MIEDADKVITSCIDYLQKVQKNSIRGKLSDRKYVFYYAYFLNLLWYNGYPVQEQKSLFFEKISKAMSIKDQARRAALEYKFYHALIIFQKQFAQYDVMTAAEYCLAFIERGKLSKYQKRKTMERAGMRATEILLASISSLV